MHRYCVEEGQGIVRLNAHRRYRSRLLSVRYILISAAAFVFTVFLSASEAQITLDGSVGPQGALAGPDYRIGAELGRQRGANLFHSFGDFNIRTGESATFTGPNSVENVIGRVTGGNPSAIDGPLRSEIPDANLYLLNPNGVLFGPHASLDVQGSFHVSTADYLKLADGAEFHADLGKGSTLSVAPPEAFGFLHSRPGGIVAQGSQLQVPDGKTLSVVGGDVEVTGGVLTAHEGHVNLASIGSAGEARLTQTTVDIPATQQGNVTLNGSTFVDVAGQESGTISIKGGQILLDDQTFVQAGSAGPQVADETQKTEISIDGNTVMLTGGAVVADVTQGDKAGGEMVVHARERVTITGQNTRLNSTTMFGSGDGSPITLTTPALEMSNGGLIRTRTGGNGNAGKIALHVNELTMTSGAAITSESGFNIGELLFVGSGRGGDVLVESQDSVTVRESAIFNQTVGNGGTGKITLSTRNGLVFDKASVGTRTTGTGNAGDVVIETGRLHSENSGISSNNWAIVEGRELVGKGQAGNVSITAADAISIQGGGVSTQTLGSGNAGSITLSTPKEFSLGKGAQILADTGGDGDAGNLSVHVGALSMREGSRIGSGSGVTVGERSVVGKGNGGNISIVVDGPISMVNGGVTANTTGSGNSGSISLSGSKMIMSDKAAVTVITSSDGNSGDITIKVSELQIGHGAQINGNSGFIDEQGKLIVGKGNGGNITVTATDSISLSGPGFVVLSATGGSGDAGNVSVSAPVLEMSDGAVVEARTVGDGNGGDITIDVRKLQMRNGAQISNPSGFIDAQEKIAVGKGQAGNVSITAADAISIQGGGVSTQTLGSGNAGSITLSTPKEFSLGKGAQILADTGGDGDAGNIEVRAEHLSMNGSRIASSSGLGIGTNKVRIGKGRGGSVKVVASIAEMENIAEVAARTLGDADGGSITIDVGRLKLSTGAFINGTSGFTDHTGRPRGGKGAAGNITITAKDSISLSGPGFPYFMVVGDTFGSGMAGKVSVEASVLEMDRGAILETRTIGDGNAGEVEIRVDQLQLTGGAQIGSTSGITDGTTTFVGKGRSGTVSITANDSIRLAGRDETGTIETGVFTQTISTSEEGRGGVVTVHAPQVILTDGARIGTDTGSDAPGGEVRIMAGDSLRIDKGATISSESGIPVGNRLFVGAGRGGDVQIEAATVNLNEKGAISTRSRGPGSAGNIQVEAFDTFRSHNGIVTTDAQSAQGGQIALSAGKLVALTGQSRVTTSVQSDVGDAGKITIAGRIVREAGDPAAPPSPARFTVVAPAQFVVLDGKLLATAEQGRGGNIEIRAARAYLPSTQSETNVRSASGVSGTVDVRAPVTSISGAFTPLPETFVNTSELLPIQCEAVFLQGQRSSFVVGEREGLPLEPGAFIPSPLH